MDTMRMMYRKYNEATKRYECIYGHDLVCDDKMADCRTCNIPIAEELREFRWNFVEVVGKR